MTRYKGRASPKAIEREFPHIVEMIVPEGGFGKITPCSTFTPATAYGPSIQLGGAMRMAAISFGGASLIRNWLKRSRMSSGRRGEAKTLPQRMRIIKLIGTT
jgi:hypothetical protein